MERNWLIRTYQKQILGPVSKQKLLDFIQKGSVGFTDEVTSGNGYWFYLKEKELVEKYLFGDLPQSFNPVSEAKSVLIHKNRQEITTSLNSAPPNNRRTDGFPADKIVLPKDDDLEYPDVTQITAMVAEFPDITIISHMPSAFENKTTEASSSLLPEEAEESLDQVFPKNDDLEYPDMLISEEPLVLVTEVERDFKVELPNPLTSNVNKEQQVVKSKKIAPELKLEKKLLYERKVKNNHTVDSHQQKENESKPLLPEMRLVSKGLEKRNDTYLIVIFFVLIFILLGIFFYYREILNKPLPI